MAENEQQMNDGHIPGALSMPFTQDMTSDWFSGKPSESGKRGMQLWQFFYILLEDKDEQQSAGLIEWTNRKNFEFKLKEPEVVAVRWGIVKHRSNMTFEKLSRSMRYYYDQGILKKIEGERFVYCFCVDPEEMYRNMGLSADKRPKLKPVSDHPTHIDPTATGPHPMLPLADGMPGPFIPTPGIPPELVPSYLMTNPTSRGNTSDDSDEDPESLMFTGIQRQRIKPTVPAHPWYYTDSSPDYLSLSSTAQMPDLLNTEQEKDND